MSADLLGDQMATAFEESYSPEFEGFWKVYPRKKYKKKAFKAWQKNRCDRIAPSIVAHVEVRAKRDAEWLKKDGEFIPTPEAFINGHGWSDEYRAIKARSGGSERVAEPPPDPGIECQWTASVNTFLMRQMLRIGGQMRTADFEREILGARDRFVADMRASYGNRVPNSGLPPEVRAEFIEIKDAWKADMRELFNKFRSTNDESAYASLEAEGSA